MPSAIETARHRTFYAPPPWPAPGEELHLPPTEVTHAARVHRLHCGDRLRLIDGRGLEADAEVTCVEPRRLRARLRAVRSCPGELPRAVRLALPRIRSIARLDWVIEKAVELGVGAIDIFAAERSVKGRAAADESRGRRWRELTRAAMKQSGRAIWPAVTMHATLDALLATADAGAAIWVADRAGRVPSGCDMPERFASLLLLVGPEGGLSPREEARLDALCAHRIALGPHRLRTETAAVALCARAVELEWARLSARPEES
jgi:16S rRNA (uracil1498-N3)-methyltransferase